MPPAVPDLRDDPHAQWDPEVLATRRATGLSCITLDKVDQTVHQVVNGIRQNTPHINVIPNGGGADLETAKAFKGIIRGIEYESRADTAYDTAAENAVKARIGYIRIDHDYANDETMRHAYESAKLTIDPTSKAALMKMAHDAAKDAAPYVHPKLQPVDAKGSSDQVHNIVVTFK
jgi:hypothetical protein